MHTSGFLRVLAGTRLAAAAVVAGLVIVVTGAGGAEARVPDDLRSADTNARQCAGFQDSYDAKVAIANDVTATPGERFVAGETVNKLSSEWSRLCAFRFGSIAPSFGLGSGSSHPSTIKLSTNGVATVFLH